MCELRIGFKCPYGVDVPLVLCLGGGTMASMLEHVMLLTPHLIAAEGELFMVLHHHQKEADTTHTS